MGTNNPNLPNFVRCDEEAIIYLASIQAALKTQTYIPQTGAGPFTLTAVQMVGTVVEFSGATTAVVVNTATGAAIIAQMQTIDPNASVGSTANMEVINDNTSSGAITMTAGDGNVTFVGPVTPALVPISTKRLYQIKWATATTVTLTPIG